MQFYLQLFNSRPPVRVKIDIIDFRFKDAEQTS